MVFTPGQEAVWLRAFPSEAATHIVNGRQCLPVAVTIMMVLPKFVRVRVLGTGRTTAVPAELLYDATAWAEVEAQYRRD